MERRRSAKFLSELNKLTVKNHYPLLRIDDLFDQLRGAYPFLRMIFGRRKNEVHLKLGVRVTEEGRSCMLVFKCEVIPTFHREIFLRFVDPITSLTERNQKYEWSVEQEEAFQTLKNDLCDTPIKRIYTRRFQDVKLARIYIDEIIARNGIPLSDDSIRLRWMIYLVVLADAAESVRDAIGFEYYLASSSGWTKSPVLWAEIGESSLIGLELVQETTDKVVLVKEKLKSGGTLARASSFRTRRKCLADAKLHVPLDEIKVDIALRFVKEPCRFCFLVNTKGPDED
ncbi:hypothetical protein Tco_0493865 [Tanacetum coccineum]